VQKPCPASPDVAAPISGGASLTRVQGASARGG